MDDHPFSFLHYQPLSKMVAADATLTDQIVNPWHAGVDAQDRAEPTHAGGHPQEQGRARGYAGAGEGGSRSRSSICVVCLKGASGLNLV